MQTQNFKNHSRLVPMYHYVLFFLLMIIFGWSVIHFVKSINMGASRVQSLMFMLVSIALLLIFFLFRGFALKAQDRAIRAEESLRTYVLTGALPDSKLTIQQIIALRFASDEEFVALSQRAAKENLSNKEIKQAIQNWKGDYYRV